MKKKSFLTKNIWLKLASFVLAFALWVFVILSGRSGSVIDTPVMYTNLPEGLELVEYPKSVNVTIEGQERLLKSLRLNEISAVIDLRNAKPGRNFYSIPHENIKLPKTFEVTNIDPQTISLTIENQMKKTVQVQPVIVGMPERGFVIYQIQVDPETLVLEGPQSIISKINTLKTESIDITGVSMDISYIAKLNLPNTGVRANVQKVDVNIILRKLNSKER